MAVHEMPDPRTDGVSTVFAPRHLRVLRETGLVEVRQEAQRRVYSLRPAPLAEVDEWLSRYRALWEQRLDALHTEVARGKRERRSTA
jgi:DNA-binding transcriptional ArsR family regulator